MQIENKSRTLCKILYTGVAAFTLFSCSDSSQRRKSQLQDSTIGAASIGRAVEVGYGYSEKTGKFLSTQCVNGATDTKNLPLTGGDVSFLLDASYSDIVDSLSGTLDMSLNLASIKASAGAELAKKSSRTELTTNIYAYLNIIGKTQYLKAAGRSYGAGVLVPGVNPEKYCGTDFVSQIDFGASMAVALEVTAKTKKQKEKIAGYIKVNLANILNGSGSLENIDEDETQDYRIRLTIKQVGGVPQNVSLAIPDDGIFCGVQDMKSCVAKMNNAIAYMKTQMRSDLENLKNWNPVNYHTISYENTGDLQKLAPVKLTDAQKELLNRSYDLIKAEYQTTMADIKDIDTMLSSDLTSSEITSLKSTQQSILGNAVTLDRAITRCQDDYEYCTGIAGDFSRLNLKSYDSNFRSAGYSRRAKLYCDKLLRAALSSGEIVDTEFNDLAREGSAPVFQEPKNSASAVVGSAPCMDVFEESLAN